ncbi:hypothetical protein [Actinomadura montaniterrae]|uniref:Uncharacterized protein n=1 Tax=Actinomadura montaniterrae TaxID=1803903 RepID=A0A6L3VUR6_9ACTN|nr:hypothetical protein [Actinomadura montaniterrae]KAB2372055.1 hypothetical protein F9B16_30785 [Actinomadura montaniterrae]
MDIFPRSDDPGTMEDRRAVLKKALRLAGLAAATPFLGAAAPYVRLPGEQGNTDDERTRFAYEIAAIRAHLLVQPAIQNQPALLALWANLNQFQRTANVNVFDLRAWTAIFGSVNAVTLLDQQSAAAWLTQAHTYARLAGDPNLISLAHSKSANAGMYFDIDPKYLLTDATLAIKYGTTPERQGMGHAMMARAAALAGQAGVAIQAGDKAVELAETGPPESPVTDGWTANQAHMTVARSLSSFERLHGLVEEHTTEALRTNTGAGSLWRAQPLLTVAEARTRSGAIDGAAENILTVITEMESPIQFQPSIAKRVEEIVKLAEDKHPNTDAMRAVRARLAAMSV